MLGKVRAVYEKVGGAIIEKTSGVSTNLTFTGQEPDQETSLVYFGKRFYDPEVGYFLSIDPALQFASPYNYGGYDPLNSIDPDGAELFSLGTALIIAALYAGATVIDTLAKGGDLGAALKAGAIAFATSLFASMSMHVLTTALSGLSFVETARVLYGGFGMYQTFKEGNIATGMLSLGLAAFGPPGGDGAESNGDRGGSRVSSNGTPAAPDRLTSLEQSSGAVAAGTQYADAGNVATDAAPLGNPEPQLARLGDVPADPPYALNVSGEGNVFEVRADQILDVELRNPHPAIPVAALATVGTSRRGLFGAKDALRPMGVVGGIIYPGMPATRRFSSLGIGKFFVRIDVPGSLSVDAFFRTVPPLPPARQERLR